MLNQLVLAFQTKSFNYFNLDLTNIYYIDFSNFIFPIIHLDFCNLDIGFFETNLGFYLTFSNIEQDFSDQWW